jgi:hypothetical protein
MPKGSGRGQKMVPDEGLMGGAEHTGGEGKNSGGTEARVTATVGAGREVMRQAGQNASAAANAFEARVSQGGAQH